MKIGNTRAEIEMYDNVDIHRLAHFLLFKAYIFISYLLRSI